MNAPACARLSQPQHHYSSPSRKKLAEGTEMAPRRRGTAFWRRQPGASRSRWPPGRQAPLRGRRSPEAPVPRHASPPRGLRAQAPSPRPARRPGTRSGRRAVGRPASRLGQAGPADAGTGSRRLCARNGSASAAPARSAGPLRGIRADRLWPPGPRSGPRTSSAGPATARPGTRPGRGEMAAVSGRGVPVVPGGPAH